MQDDVTISAGHNFAVRQIILCEFEDNLVHEWPGVPWERAVGLAQRDIGDIADFPSAALVAADWQLSTISGCQPQWVQHSAGGNGRA